MKQKLKYFFYSLRYILYFTVLIISFHYIYKLWSGHLYFFPIKEQIDNLFKYASLLLYDQSNWLLVNIFNVDFTTDALIQTFYFKANNGQLCFVEVSPGCTSLKQWMHWLFLMIIFPGPWKHKLWYIPLGLFIIEWVNVVRITGLVLTSHAWPNQFHFFHDYIFKIFFYLMIFLMWLFWVELFVEESKKTLKSNQTR